MNKGQKEKLVLPNFLCIGAQKAGSSTLYKLLRQHPDIYMSETKEVKFFDRDINFAKGLDYYASFFKDNYKGQKLIGEVTPDYMQYTYTAERIKESLGEVKVIAILRHPVKRAFSQYNFHKMLGHEKSEKSFIQLLKEEEANPSISTRETWYEPAYYKSKSLYYPQIKRYVDVFGKENVHLVIFEEMLAGESPDLKSCCEFLGVKPFKFEQFHSNPTIMNLKSPKVKFLQTLNQQLKKIIPAVIYQPIQNKLKKKVFEKPEKLDKEIIETAFNQYFLNDTVKLEQLMDIDLSIWKA